MRKANIHDLFNASRLLNKLDLKDEVFKIQSTINSDSNEERIGFDFVLNVFEKASGNEMENEIYKVLSGPFEMTEEEVAKMEIAEFCKSTLKCFNLETLLNFISRANQMG